MKTMEMKGQKIPPVSHRAINTFFNFMSKSWLESDDDSE